MPEIDWKNTENTRIICALFAEQVGRGNRTNTYLNALGYEEVQKGFKDRTGIDATKLQLKNKWDKLKEDFKAWKKLKHRQTGAGWNRQNGTIVMDDEWWKKAKEDIPGCGKFRKQPLQHEEELETCFADITNIGTDHWSPRGANLQMPPLADETQEGADGGIGEEHGEDLGDVPTETPPSGKRPARAVQNKGKKLKTGNALLIQEAVTSMASSASEYASKREGKFSIDQVMEVVLGCGANYGSNEHYIATELFVKKEQREMFMTMPTEEIRLNWLTRKYNDKHGE
ncbi:unnamed protein product [Urochloa humidicola]